MWGHNFLKTSRRSFRRQLDTRRCIKTTWYLWRFFSALYFVPRPPGILPSAVKFLRRLTPYELKNQINFVVRRTRDIGQKNFQTSRPLRSFSKLSFFILDFGYLLQDYFFCIDLFVHLYYRDKRFLLRIESERWDKLACSLSRQFS